ncbi:MAG TPA: hypothetical protein VGE53_02275 [Candidatus Paceibacterota bacterium]
MNVPSIESHLSRRQEERTYPIAKRMHDLPVVGIIARAWVRATQSEEPRVWASLPPVVA